MIPQKLRNKVLEELHQAHSGIVRMKAIAKSHMWWPKLDNDIAVNEIMWFLSRSEKSTTCGTFALMVMANYTLEKNSCRLRRTL